MSRVLWKLSLEAMIPFRNSNKIMALSILCASWLGCEVAASAETLCTYGRRGVMKGDSGACYSDDGCALIAKLGADPIRDFDQTNAPYALARGKIAAIVTSHPTIIQKVKGIGGSCRPLGVTG